MCLEKLMVEKIKGQEQPGKILNSNSNENALMSMYYKAKMIKAPWYWGTDSYVHGTQEKVHCFLWITKKFENYSSACLI